MSIQITISLSLPYATLSLSPLSLTWKVYSLSLSPSVSLRHGNIPSPPTISVTGAHYKWPRNYRMTSQYNPLAHTRFRSFFVGWTVSAALAPWGGVAWSYSSRFIPPLPSFSHVYYSSVLLLKDFIHVSSPLFILQRLLYLLSIFLTLFFLYAFSPTIILQCFPSPGFLFLFFILGLFFFPSSPWLTLLFLAFWFTLVFFSCCIFTLIYTSVSTLTFLSLCLLPLGYSSAPSLYSSYRVSDRKYILPCLPSSFYSIASLSLVFL